MLKELNSISLEDKPIAAKIYGEVIENLNISSDFFRKKELELKTRYTSLEKNSKIPEKFIRKLHLAYKRAIVGKSTNSLHALGLADRSNYKKLEKSLPKHLQQSLRNLSKNLTNRDKYVLYKKANDVWVLSHDEDYVLGDMAQLVYYIKKSYQNPREYLDVHSRTYIEDFIDEYLTNFARTKKIRNFLSLLSVDVNGLKTVNDFGVSRGHIDGNKFLLVFTHVMQSGKTTQLLESMGIKIHVAAQSGDEYLILFESKYNIFPITDIIEQLYLNELMSIEKDIISRRIRRPDGTITNYKKDFNEIDIANIIDYDYIETRNLFESKGLIPNKNEKFRITCSFGWSHMNQILEQVELNGEDDFFVIRKEIKNIFISISDHNAIKNKKSIKQAIKDSGLLQLYALLTIRSDLYEVVKIRRENEALRKALANNGNKKIIY